MKGIHTNSKIARMPDSLMLVGSGMLAEFYNFIPCLAVSVNVHEIKFLSNSNDLFYSVGMLLRVG